MIPWWRNGADDSEYGFTSPIAIELPWCVIIEPNVVDFSLRECFRISPCLPHDVDVLDGDMENLLHQVDIVRDEVADGGV